MNKRGLFNGKITFTIIILVLFFFTFLTIFPINPEDISGNLIKYDIIESIEPKSNSETSNELITIKVVTEKEAICKSSKRKIGGYFMPYKDFDRTNHYYHETTLYLDKGKNYFKIYCKQLSSKIYDYNYWSIKRL